MLLVRPHEEDDARGKGDFLAVDEVQPLPPFRFGVRYGFAQYG